MKITTLGGQMLYGNLGNSKAEAGSFDRGALLNVFYTALMSAGLGFVTYLIGWLASADLGAYSMYIPIFVTILRVFEQLLRDRSKIIQ